MVKSTDLRPQRHLNAAELAGTRNRITLSSDIMRSIAAALGYDDLEAFDSATPDKASDLFDPADMVELLLRSKLRSLRVTNTAEQEKESEIAERLIERVIAGRFSTRSEIHDKLPSEKVALLKMGPPRLWGYAVRQRLALDAETALPHSVPFEPTGPATDPEEAWLGTHITDATSLESLVTVVDDVPVHEDRHQRLRLGMGLSDRFDQVWSSARGHWSVGPDTRYIVPSCYGWCPYVFRVAENGWRADEFEGSRDRYIATHGYFIDVENQRLIELGAPDPHNAWRPRVTICDELPSDRDMEVASVLSDALIALGSHHRNPVIRLRQPGRRLF